MSVIAGIWHLDGAPPDHDFLLRMSERLARYGPDGEFTFFGNAVGMLFRAFHTTPESRLERQPYKSPAANFILWDGRLDNRDELASQLGGSGRDDQTDLDIVSAAVDRWGANSFIRMIGEWAIAIWNPRNQELLLARDYIGVKQLFYYPNRTKIVWCNHLAALALCGERFSLSEDYVAGFLAFYPDAHLTPYNEIHSVPPGKFVSICNQRIRIETYWSALDIHRIRYKEDGEYVEHYREVFRQAVRRRLRTDSRILSELSGGFDSSSVVCMADDIMKKENLSAPGLDTFSFHDSKEPEEDDFGYFTTVEAQRGKPGLHADLHGSGDSFLVENSSFVATPGPGGRAELRAAFSTIVEPLGYRVMLSGFGGDQMNGQTLDPRILMAELLLQLRFLEFAKQLRTWSLLIRKRPLIQLLLQTLVQFVPVQIRAQFKNHMQSLPWINSSFARNHRVSARMLEVVDGVWFIRPGARDAVQTMNTLSRHLTNSRPSAIEKRYPYLDRNLAEFLIAVPLDQLLRPGQRRWLMRRAVADILPPEVLNRTIKARVGRYPCLVMEKHWNRIEEALSSSLAARLGYINRNHLRDALVAMKNGRLPRYLVRLINAISLEFWLGDAQSQGIIDLDFEQDTRIVEQATTRAATGALVKDWDLR